MMLPLLGIVSFLCSYGVSLLADRIGTYHIYCAAILGKAAVCSVAAVLAFLGCPSSVIAIPTVLLVQLSMLTVLPIEGSL